MVRLILIAILLGLLTACGTSGLEPSSQVVKRALVKLNEIIALELSQEQNSSGYPQIPRFKINQLVITEQKPLVIQNLPAYQVRGTYNLTTQLPRRQVSGQQNSFEVYLQRQQEGKTWRIMLPQSNGKDSSSTWRTYLIS